MKRKFCIGNLELNNPFLLAPMAGFTDKSMRALCARQGASLTFTEMVSGKGLKYGDRKTRKLLELGEEELPHTAPYTASGGDSAAPGSGGGGRLHFTGYQLFGSEPEILMYAAEELAACENAVLDLNCGCPVPKIVKNGEGAALLKNLDLLYECVAAMVTGAQRGAGADSEWNRTPKPVTAKIRMGFGFGENVAVEAARAVEAAGAAAVTVHGRTRMQYYEGKADWQVIADVKKAVNIPVIGNGDVRTGADAIRMMDETGCDAVMIARGALGNPWIFAEANSLWEADRHPGKKGGASEEALELPDIPALEARSKEERIEMLIRHIEMVCEDKGERIGVKEMRKFVGYYTRGMHGATAVRRQANSTDTAAAMIELLESLK
ncbi:MAG: tRNA-dihydrouridine synthase [Bacillota bacterium]|nr:tRNA-dihydrouridine synthase [Bacillota bacterium]